jgi:uncharacterized membrane protein YfcA
MISSVSVFLQFSLLGRVNYSYAVLLVVTAFIATKAGITFTNAYIKKSGRQSIILLFLITILSVAFLSLPIKMITNYVGNRADMQDLPWYEIAKKISTLNSVNYV